MIAKSEPKTPTEPGRKTQIAFVTALRMILLPRALEPSIHKSIKACNPTEVKTISSPAQIMNYAPKNKTSI
jgi:hypothetical protein